MEEKLRILVTDDEEGMRLGVDRALKKFLARFVDLDVEVQYELTLAETGEEAISSVEAEMPDLLLLDYKLPGISGLDVLARLTEKQKLPLTIMITAYASLDTAISATKLGAYDFLAKPFTPEELKASVRKATHHLILERQAKRLAEEKNRVRFEFISVLSHELKAPLGAIEGYLNMIKDGTVTEPEKLAHVVERSLIRVNGMRKLIFDLLDLTRIESGSKARAFSDFDLAEIAGTCIETFEPEARGRGIETSLSCESPVSFFGDRGEMEIVVNNLISNAIKYNRDGGRIGVTVRKKSDGCCEISVSDTGIGMSEEETKRIFGNFVRIKNEKTKNILGSGLGLSTVKKIAALYGGDVSVTSHPDEGTTFTVTLRGENRQ